MSERIQRKRTAGWRLPEGAICVTRPSKYANPFAVRPLPGGRWQVVDINDRSRGVREEPQIFTSKSDAVVFAVRFYELHIGPMGLYELDVDEVRRDLGGKSLACWCPLPEPGEPYHCHAATLLATASGEEP